VNLFLSTLDITPGDVEKLNATFIKQVLLKMFRE